ACGPVAFRGLKLVLSKPVPRSYSRGTYKTLTGNRKVRAGYLQRLDPDHRDQADRRDSGRQYDLADTAQGKERASHCSGSTDAPATWSSQCRCGPVVAAPVLSLRAIRSPAPTVCPTRTRNS